MEAGEYGFVNEFPPEERSGDEAVDKALCVVPAAWLGEGLKAPPPRIAPAGRTIKAHTATTIGSNQRAFRPGNDGDIADADGQFYYRKVPGRTS
ncbi:MAG: hypothetical protein ABR888_03045 [Thermoplasmata archaeon]|jgi:hypothetical protein